MELRNCSLTRPALESLPPQLTHVALRNCKCSLGAPGVGVHLNDLGVDAIALRNIEVFKTCLWFKERCTIDTF